MDEFIPRSEFDVQVQRITDEEKRQNHRIDKLEESYEVVNRLATNIERLAIQIENMQTEIKKQGARLEKIEDEPADNWKALIKTAITGIVSALVAYFLAKGGII